MKIVLQFLEDSQPGHSYTNIQELLASMTDFQKGSFLEMAVRRGLLEQGTVEPASTDLNMSPIVKPGPNAERYLIDENEE